MRYAAKPITATAMTTLIGALALTTSAVAAEGKPMTAYEQGKAVAFDTKRGNCLACHYIEGGDLPGTIGPALVSMQLRYPSKDKLRAQIFDASKNNPNTVMPPFGRHQILSEEELNQVVEFVYSL